MGVYVNVHMRFLALWSTCPWELYTLLYTIPACAYHSCAASMHVVCCTMNYAACLEIIENKLVIAKPDTNIIAVQHEMHACVRLYFMCPVAHAYACIVHV